MSLLVPGFSKCTRRTAGARYRPDLNRSSNPDRFASRSASYCAAVTPSTPAAASLRDSPVGFAASTPRRCGAASVVRVIFGSLRASSAILRCRVEMTSRPNVPAICPSASSIIRSAASPSAGSSGASSPTSSVLSADSDFSPPLARHFVSFAQHYHRFARLRSLGTGRFPESLDHFIPRRPRRLSTVEKTRYPRFLDDPCVHAPLFDPGRTPNPRPIQG